MNLWWLWLILSLLIIAAIVVIVLVIVYAQNCKKSFSKAFGDKYGNCLFDASKNTLSTAHFKQVCQIVENCPTQLHDCVQTIKDLISHLLPPYPTAVPDIFDKLTKACPQICVTKYIDYNNMSDSEKQQWAQEIQAMAQYLAQHCSIAP